MLEQNVSVEREAAIGELAKVTFTIQVLEQNVSVAREAAAKVVFIMQVLEQNSNGQLTIFTVCW